MKGRGLQAYKKFNFHIFQLLGFYNVVMLVWKLYIFIRDLSHLCCSTSSVQHEISDDGEWRPSGTAADGPLRRSPRKQNIPVRIHVRRSARNMVTERKQFKKDENSKGQALITVTDSSIVIEEVDAAGIITTDEHLKTEVVPGWSFALCLIGEYADMFLGNFEEI